MYIHHIIYTWLLLFVTITGYSDTSDVYIYIYFIDIAMI